MKWTKAVVLLLILSTQACIPNLKKSKAPAIPAWATLPPADTTQSIYGVGSAFSFAEAKKVAMKSISEKLITKISSQTKSELSQFNSSVSRNINQQINVSTVETQLSGVQVVKSKQVKGEFFVQVVMSRPAFIKSTTSRFNEQDQKIRRAVNSLSKQSKLQQMISVNNVMTAIGKAKGLLRLLEAADSSHNVDKHVKYYSDVVAKANDIRYKVRFHVRAERGMQKVAQKIVSLLQAENLSATARNIKNSDINIYVSGRFKNTVVFSQYFSQLKVSLKISDKNGRVAAVKNFDASGSSFRNHSESSEKAISEVEATFNKKGMFASLGLIKI